MSQINTLFNKSNNISQFSSKNLDVVFDNIINHNVKSKVTLIGSEKANLLVKKLLKQITPEYTETSINFNISGKQRCIGCITEGQGSFFRSGQVGPF